MIALSGTAAAGTAIRGDLSFVDAPALDGQVQVLTNHGALHLAPAIIDGAGIALSWDSATGYVVDRERVNYGGSGFGVAPEPEVRNASVRFGPGTISFTNPGPECLIVVYTTGQGSLALTGVARGSVAFTSEDSEHHVGEENGNDDHSFRLTIPRGAMSVTTTPSDEDLVLRDGAAMGSGRLGLVVFDAGAVIDHAGGGRMFETGTWERPETFGPGIPAGIRTSTRFLVLELTGASVAPDPGVPVRLTAADPQVTVSGTVSAAEASGWLQLGGDRIRLDREGVSVDGTLELAPRSLHPGLVALLGSQETARSTFGGDAESVTVNGQVVGAPASLEKAALMATMYGTTAAAGSYAIWTIVRRFALAPLFSRIRDDSLLANPNRHRIHAIVHERPGVTVADLSRETGLARAVVRHHVMKLVEHEQVQALRTSRDVAYFAPGTLRGSKAGWNALKDDTRRRIAQAIASSRGLSQADLCRRLDLAQRLVAYHLARMQKCGLVETEGTMPKRYVAAGGLQDLLLLQDQESQAPAHRMVMAPGQTA